MRSHFIEKLGKVSREMTLEAGLVGESINHNKPNKRGGGVVREHGLYLENSQSHCVGTLWTCAYRDCKAETSKSPVGPSCGVASLSEPQFRIMKAIERKDDLIFSNNQKENMNE